MKEKKLEIPEIKVPEIIIEVPKIDIKVPKIEIELPKIKEGKDDKNFN